MQLSCKHQAKIYYDGDCPFCDNYVRYVNLSDVVGGIEIVNVREDLQLANKFLKEGYDLDEGMLFFYEGRYYYGADCIHMMSLLSTSNGCFNRLNALLFRRRVLSKVLYPVLKLGRSMTLKLLGKRKIKE